MKIFLFSVSVFFCVVLFSNISSGEKLQKDETNRFGFRDSKPTNLLKKLIENDSHDGKIVYFENFEDSEENCSDLKSENCRQNFEEVRTEEEMENRPRHLDSLLNSVRPKLISFDNENNFPTVQKSDLTNRRNDQAYRNDAGSRATDLKRALFRNKMIRLQRRDGLKVLRLRRNLNDDSAVFGSEPEMAPVGDEIQLPVSEWKRWLFQQKKNSNLHLGNNGMGR